MGGPFYSVPRLCEVLAAAVTQTTLLSASEKQSGPRILYHKGYNDCRFAYDYARIPILRRLRISRALSSARHHDALRQTWLWLMPSISARSAAAGGATPLVVSPRGMFAPPALAFSRWKKRAFWALLQGPVICDAACIHVTSEQDIGRLHRQRAKSSN
jgi:hypothetical protein